MDLVWKTDGEGWGQCCIVESLPSLDEAKATGGRGSRELVSTFLSLKVNEVSFKNQALR